MGYGLMHVPGRVHAREVDASFGAHSEAIVNA